MKIIKNDSICKQCYYIHPFIAHRCIYTAVTGDAFTYAKSGRTGLSKDGTECKYFSLKTDKIKIRCYGVLPLQNLLKK